MLPGLLHNQCVGACARTLLLTVFILAAGMLPSARVQAEGGVTGYLAVAAGGHFACGIRADHTLACWGDSLYGQTSVPSGTFTQVSAGEFHACALRSDGKAACWGYYGAAIIAPPHGAFTHVDAGYDTDCGLTTNGGALFCWNLRKHTVSQGPGSLSAISAGIDATCGLDQSGAIRCRTYAGAGRSAPSGAFTQISGSAAQYCALRRDGTAACWGESTEGPARAAPARVFSQISTGRAHACGLLATGAALCWGYGKSGETTAPPAFYTQVSAGDDLNCGLRRDGTVDCWGSNVYGQLRAPHNLPSATIYLGNTYQSYKANLVRVTVAGLGHETGLILRADGQHAYVLTGGHLLRGVKPAQITIDGPAQGGHRGAVAVTLSPGAHTGALLAVIAISSHASYASIPWGNSYRLVKDPAVFSFSLSEQANPQPQRAPLALTAVGADRHDSLGSFWIVYARTRPAAGPGDALITADGTLMGITTALQPNGTAIAVQSNWARPIVEAQITALGRRLAS